MGRMGQPYRYVNHTADVEFIARGTTLEQAFKHALLALFNTMADTRRVGALRMPPKRIKMIEHADSLSELLWRTLQDALSITDAEALFPYRTSRLAVLRANGRYALRAEILAKPQTPECAGIYVKGVSRFDLKVSESAGGFSVSAVIDI